MIVDVYVFTVLILSIVVCDYLATYLYKKRRIAIWVSAIVIAFLIPVIVYGSLYLWYLFGDTFGLDLSEANETIAFAGFPMLVILALNAIIMFVIGVILNIYTFVRKKQKGNNHV